MHFTDAIMSYAQSTTSPILMVVLLAIVFALDPCLMITNIAAIGYIGREVTSKQKALIRGIYYTIGRTISYGILGCLMIAFLQLGKSMHPIEEFIEQYGALALVIFMITMGVLLCISDFISWLRIDLNKNIKQEHYKGDIGAFLLGIMLTFAFCPTNAMLFFGMMVPMCSASSLGYTLPFIFAITTAVPVLIISYLVAFSLNTVAKYYNQVQQISKILKIVVGLLFICIGIYLATTIGHPHIHH